MSESKPFSINVESLKTRSKATTERDVQKADQAAEKHGFLERSPKKKRGRKPSPRTGQVHAKVLPKVSEQISSEAKRRGVQQGVLIEEAWALYLKQKDI